MHEQKSPVYPQVGSIKTLERKPDNVQTSRCISEPCASAKEPYTSAREPYRSTNELWISAKEPYIFAKEPYTSAKEPCISTNGLYKDFGKET